MDIGTNAEIVIGNKDWLACAAASAGPAFEGGGIKLGMRATEGAIEDFSIDPVTLEPLDSAADLDDLEHRFASEIVDQQFRLDLERRFGGLRRLIVQHAFAPLEHLREEVKKTVGRD